MTSLAQPLRSSPSLARPRKDHVIYWISTALLAAVMAFSIVNFTFFDHFPPWNPHGPSGFVHLGLPPYFKVELTLAKLLGLVALLAPRVPRRIRDLAYFGFALDLASAVVAHTWAGDAALSPIFIIDPLVFLGLLGTSWVFGERLAGQARLGQAK
ncbi:MAG TPA: DoxX family protein [Myxococcales bacterium]|nr:DoxX family protein [Myxococcales bacterium]